MTYIFFFFLRVMFYLVDFLRTSSLGHSISDNAEKTVPKRQGGSQDI